MSFQQTENPECNLIFFVSRYNYHLTHSGIFMMKVLIKSNMAIPKATPVSTYCHGIIKIP